MNRDHPAAPVSPPPPCPCLGRTERLVVLGAVAGLFGVFLLLQLTYLFDNAPSIQLTLEKDHVETNGPRRVELFEDQVGVACRQARVQAAGQSSGLAVTRGVDHLEVRMLGAQTKQLGSRVARCTDDADSFHDA